MSQVMCEDGQYNNSVQIQMWSNFFSVGFRLSEQIIGSDFRKFLGNQIKLI